MNNRQGAESLVDSLRYEIAGDREVRRKMAILLINKILEEKALVKVRQKYQLQGLGNLSKILEDLEELRDVWADEAVVEAVKPMKPGPKDACRRVEEKAPKKGGRPKGSKNKKQASYGELASLKEELSEKEVKS